MEDLARLRHARILVTGRVQGVYYRASTVNAAQDIGATGWVRNLLDGSVEIEVEGSVEQIEQLIAWCWQGPAGARVEQVVAEWLDQLEGFQGFEIKR